MNVKIVAKPSGIPKATIALVTPPRPLPPCTAAIESLRTYALGLTGTNGREACIDRGHSVTLHERDQFAAFAHMCTAALGGEEWAIERLNGPLLKIGQLGLVGSPCYVEAKLEIIRSTDTTPGAP